MQLSVWVSLAAVSACCSEMSFSCTWLKTSSSLCWLFRFYGSSTAHISLCWHGLILPFQGFYTNLRHTHDLSSLLGSSHCFSKGEVFCISKKVAPHCPQRLASPFSPFCCRWKALTIPLCWVGINCSITCAPGKRHPVQCHCAGIASHFLQLLVSRPSPTPYPSSSLPPQVVILIGFSPNLWRFIYMTIKM